MPLGVIGRTHILCNLKTLLRTTNGEPYHKSLDVEGLVFVKNDRENEELESNCKTKEFQNGNPLAHNIAP